MEFLLTSFYKLVPLDHIETERVRAALLSEGTACDLRGLLILAPEGINGTVCGPRPGVEQFKATIPTIFKSSDWQFKDSVVPRHVFKRYSVQIRDEVVTSAGRVMLHAESQFNHLKPAEWNVALEDRDAVVIDTRNSYEYEIGHFKNALDLGMDHYSDFPEKLAEAQIPRDKKILMYCTGGIRCEKAIHEARALGYEKVFQLEGGILNYLAEFPEREFEGECFVFDDRTAVDQRLLPSERYSFCPHCGMVAENWINCVECGTAARVCADCQKQPQCITCSLNCAYHAGRKAELSISE